PEPNRAVPLGSRDNRADRVASAGHGRPNLIDANRLEVFSIKLIEQIVTWAMMICLITISARLVKQRWAALRGPN
nr:hypothetical protein [Gammaproteobacteria bacterium]